MRFVIGEEEEEIHLEFIRDFKMTWLSNLMFICKTLMP